ncbi:nuclear transport factor 2 family protein [Acinetobacter baumannii]|nr:nuclear transport factor 2 family protein [Acinetobacter baumannii]MDC5570916.1 nuclear transport factor 2 family protein [Acinetobacter baumannii]
MDQNYHRILEVITRFQLVFDQKNWDAFDELLADQLEVDYLQFRGEPLCVVSCHEYKGSRQQALSHLRLQHNLSNPLIRIEQDQAWLECNYQIYRFSENDYFHSFGRYYFTLAKQQGIWKITGICQHLTKNIGNPRIHFSAMGQC